MTVPTFSQWLALSEQERFDQLSHWAYREEARSLMERIAEDFRANYRHLNGLGVNGVGIHHGGTWVIDVNVPFVFDRRQVPSAHLGIYVHCTIRPDDLPPEFREGTRRHVYIWAPPHYEQFVDRCGHDIGSKLGQPAMTREEMLSALVGMPFDAFVGHCRTQVAKGLLAPFE